MTLRMQQRLTRWGSFTDVDLPAIGAGDFRLTVSYSHSARLTWSCLEPQHTAPIPAGAFIRFWVEDELAPDGDEFDEDNPLFIGYVEMPEPAEESIGVNYTAYCPMFRATREVTIFSAAWPAGDPISSTPPVRPAGAVPRLLYNVRISADPDWSHQVGGDGTLGQLIAGILEYTYHPLVWADAAPGDGTALGAELPYDSDDLDALTVKPQEKLDFASESPYSAIQRCMRYDPRFRCVFDPPTRLWRFHDITQAPAKTIVLNTRATARPPVSVRLIPSTENCLTAITIFGPPAPYTRDLFWDDPVDPYAAGGVYPAPLGELTPIGDPDVYQDYSTAGGIFQARFWKQFQITDSTLRRGARELPLTYQYANSPFIFSQTAYPLLLVSFSHGETWVEWPAYFDYLNGIVEFVRPPVFVQTDESGMSIVPASTQIYFCPNAVRLIWAPYGEPLVVRRPETGYEGTAYEKLNVRYEEFQNDEALMVGREFGQPVTVPARRAAFEAYAQSILDQRKDVVWTGAAVLDGLDFDYCRLNRKVKFFAQDGSGNFLATGWETIEAYATDVEYDFAEQTTSITFSADKLTLFGKDPALLKEELRIRPLEQMIEYQTQFIYAMIPLPNGTLVNQVVGVQTTPVFHYVDNPSAQQQQSYRDYLQTMSGAAGLSGGPAA